MIKVSVTVPIYNAESFLRQCLDSLAMQSLSEIEFILVDDGSTDGSSVICDEYAFRDSRFRVFHKVNGGSASARQLGLEHSQGKYCIICDADDWVESSMYEELYNKAEKENADIVVCDCFYEYPNGSSRLVQGLKTDLLQEHYLRGLISGINMGSSWNKLVRVDVLKKYNISYKLGLNHGEDRWLLMNILLHPVSISYLNESFYHYRRQFGGNTYTNHLTVKSFEQIAFLHNWIVEHFSKSKYGKEIFSANINYLFTALRVSSMSEMEYKKIWSQCVSYSSFVKYRIFSLKVCLILISGIDYDFAKRIFRNLYRYFYR